MKHPSYIPVIECPASPIAIAPMAESLEASLLAMMFHLLEGREMRPFICPGRVRAIFS
jgi:hypothetical protein